MFCPACASEYIVPDLRDATIATSGTGVMLAASMIGSNAFPPGCGIRRREFLNWDSSRKGKKEN